MLRTTLFFILVSFAVAQKARFENYKVFRINPKSDEELDLLKSIEEISDGFSYWRKPSNPHQSADLMVAPHLLADFTELMSDVGIEYQTYVSNVQQLIDQENPSTHASSGFGWTSYHTLDEIYSWLDSLAQKYPDRVQVLTIGKSYEGRDLKGVKISFGQDNPGIFIEGGVHAREWISPATVTYLVNELLTSNDTAVRHLAEKHDWYIFPSINPDGYVYSHEKNRLWRKTRSYNGHPTCKGTDGNRNWDYQWMVIGSSNNPCSETFAGNYPFSEIEMKTLSEYVKSLQGKIYAYIAFHSYSQLLMFPYGHTTQHLDNYYETNSMGEKAIQALSARYGTKYRTGCLGETIYLHSGISIDWVKAKLKLPLSFVYELRDTGRHGFVLPANQIIPNSEEILDSLVAMFKEATRFGYPKPN